MIIRSIELSDFRNIKNQSVYFDDGVNILYGDNAQGKTNLLEAVFLSCTTKSHKGARDKEMIGFGNSEAHIRTVFEKDGAPVRVDMHLRASKAKGVAIDGIRMKRAADFLKKLSARVIFFSPEDLDIIKGAPSGRRRFLDLELCQMNAGYMEALSRYQKTLSQRANLLRTMEENGAGQDALLDVYDEALCKDGIFIINERRSFIKTLEEAVRSTHIKLSDGIETMFMTYEADTQAESYADELKKNRRKDIFTHQTNAGPHRDDVRFEIIRNGNNEKKTDVRRYGSQGQQRTTALSLKLAEIEMAEQNGKIKPVLLLDDVLSELDEVRQDRLLSAIGSIQTIMTCTGVGDFIRKRVKINKLFRVKGGEVITEN